MHTGKYWQTLKAFVMAGKLSCVLSLVSAATAAASFSASSCCSCCAPSLVEACYAACTYCLCAWNSQEINTINTLIANFRLRYIFFAKFRQWDKRCSQTHLHCLRCRRRRHPFLHLRVWKSCSHMCVYCKYSDRGRQKYIKRETEREGETAPEMKAINTLMTLGNSAAKFTSPQRNSTNCCGICAPSHC